MKYNHKNVYLIHATEHLFMWNLVLVDEESASSFLSRSLLYNSWDLELVVPDNLERECIEELCSYEEAREIFEDNTQTVILLILMFFRFNIFENRIIHFYPYPWFIIL